MEPARILILGTLEALVWGCSPTSLAKFDLGHDLLSISHIGSRTPIPEWNELVETQLGRITRITIGNMAGDIYIGKIVLAPLRHKKMLAFKEDVMPNFLSSCLEIL